MSARARFDPKSFQVGEKDKEEKKKVRKKCVQSGI